MQSGLAHSDDSPVDSGSLELIAATPAHESLISNLLQLYIHDFSELIPLELDPDGRFAYPDLRLYWSEPSRFPFLATVDGAWAGLVFVRQIHGAANEAPIWDMVEFFVLRGYRHRGIGTRLAHLAFARFPGAWQVRVMEANATAARFWERAIESYTHVTREPSRVILNNAAWQIFRFESRP